MLYVNFIRNGILYFWELIIETAQQQWNKPVKVSISVLEIEKPVTNNQSHSLPHLERAMAKKSNMWRQLSGNFIIRK